jgi:hypothetical protein
MEQFTASTIDEPIKPTERLPAKPLAKTLTENDHLAGSSRPDISAQRLTPTIRSAIWLLKDAADCADELQRDRWEFSVELSALHRLGLSVNECRWLLATGLAKHACETTSSHAVRRIFQPCANLSFPKRTCLVISERGLACATTVLRGERRSAASSHRTPASPRHVTSDEDGAQPRTPTWDPDRQQLRVGKKIVKEFKVPAANQEAILAAFQEDGWVPRIDDPLPPSQNQDSKRRLHDTINSLNRSQRHPLVRFLGDGKGEGIRWEFYEPAIREDGHP